MPGPAAQTFSGFQVLGYLTRAADEVADYKTFVAYMSGLWNFLDMVNVMAFIVVIGLRVAWTLRGLQMAYNVPYHETKFGDVNVPDETNHDHYYRIRITFALWRYSRSVFAFGVLVNFFKAFKYVGASKRLSQATLTMVRAVPDVVISFCPVFFLLTFY